MVSTSWEVARKENALHQIRPSLQQPQGKFTFLENKELTLLISKPYIFNPENSELVPIHPCFSLTLRGVLENGLPSDMKLLPEQCIALYNSLSKRASDLGTDMTNLDPDKFLKVLKSYAKLFSCF
jgi:hypothetical protein